MLLRVQDNEVWALPKSLNIVRRVLSSLAGIVPQDDGRPGGGVEVGILMFVRNRAPVGFTFSNTKRSHTFGGK